MSDQLETRVRQFEMLALPGQPKMMHMGDELPRQRSVGGGAAAARRADGSGEARRARNDSARRSGGGSVQTEIY